MKTHFINNYDKLLEFIKSKNSQISIEIVTIYNMSINIDYGALEQKLIQTKQVIDSEKIEHFNI
jgi:hypothetical protein